MAKTEKTKLQEALDKLNKDYGEGSVIVLSSSDHGNYEIVSTGSIGLDAAIGIKGLPYGRIVEVYGPESAGKTTVCLHIIAEAQKQGKKVAIVDMEHAMDLKYAEKLGIQIKDLIFSQPDNGEQAWNTIKTLAETGEIGVILLDSIAACVPKAESEGDIGDANIGKQARLMSQSLRMVTPVIEKNNVLLLMTNQLRMKIGVMFGSPEVVAGGEASKYYSSIRLDIRKSILKDGDEAYANKTRVKVVKNKVGIPYRTAEFEIVYNEGINKIQEVIDLGGDCEVLKKWGSQITYLDVKYPIEEFKEMLKNEEFYEEIRQKIINKLYI